MTLLERYEQAAMTPGYSLFRFARDMGLALDEIAATIGQREDAETAPTALPSDTESWSRAFDSANGNGDVLNRIRAMAETIDKLQAWAATRPAKMSVDERMAKARAARKAA